MLDPEDLNTVLEQANTGGVLTTILVNQQGALVAVGGDGDKAAFVRGTVCSSIISSYEQKKSTFDTVLKSMVISCEKGFVAIEKISKNGLILCMLAEKHVCLGLLIAKIKAVVNYLHEPLSKMD